MFFVFFFISEKPLILLNVHYKVREEDGHKFLEGEKTILEWKDVENAQFYLGNLFNGDKSLEESTNAILNGNWRPIFEALQPSLSQAMESIIKDHMTKLLAHLPAEYYLKGLE